ncbi:MAG: RpiR-family transcriptional regulator, partial [Paenibacillus sp.]|nr:RpiR-family transcriptional regulator [Paenibacillus sp.]
HQAKKQNVKVIAVTDRTLSPVGRLADITLTIDVNVDSGMLSMASVISLLNLLIFGIKMKDPTQFHTRQQQVEQMYNALDISIE